MNNDIEILRFNVPVLLAGPADTDFNLFKRMAEDGFPVIAADGGANRLSQNGINPMAIIGDLDSLDITPEEKKRTKIIQLTEQDSTDFEKCLYSVEAPLFIAFGFTGKRLDHTLATIHCMSKYHASKNLLLLGEEDVSFIQCGNFCASIGPKRFFSIYPLMPIRFSHSEGLEFPLGGLEFEIGANIATSNRTTSNNILICPSPEYQHTPYLVSLPREQLEKLIDLALLDGKTPR